MGGGVGYSELVRLMVAAPRVSLASLGLLLGPPPAAEAWDEFVDGG